MNYPDFAYIEKRIRKRTFGVLGTVDGRGRPHSTGLVYGVAPKDHPFALYVLTGAKYKKTRNVKRNPAVSFVIPFPHHWLRFIPDYVVQFQGTATILPVDDEIAVESFSHRMILRENLKAAEKIARERTDDEAVFIKITPDRKIHVFGLGIGPMTMLRNVEAGAYSVEIPEDRL